MATSRGKDGVKAYMADAPKQLQKLLRGAAKAGAGVVMDEAKQSVASEAVREGLRMRSRADGGHIVVKIDVAPGWARSLGTWLEYGTSPHFITVDDRSGRSAGRVNRLGKQAAKDGSAGPSGTLLINGKPVGASVYHPGSRKEPFLRVALDRKQADAVSTAQAYINARVKPSGITVDAEPEGDDA